VSLHQEIFEQPVCLEALLASQRGLVEHIAEEIKARDIEFVFLAARGTSDNAGRYANYVWGAFNHLPVALATPSLFTYYDRPPVLKNALVIGISQSGQSPDIVSVLAEGRRQGNLTLAITNNVDSPLARAADLVLPINTGPELAVAATKTYTSELMAVAMLSAALSGDEAQWQDLSRVAGWAREMLGLDETIQQAALRYRYMQQCVVLGRGYNYATAYEWALKLKELTYVEAEPYSPADFLHGPVAMVSEGFPVLAVAPGGRVLEPMLTTLSHLRKDLNAELVVISNSPEALGMAKIGLEIPADVPEWLSPLISIIPAQLFAYHLTLTKGFDTEKPRTIRKVTETR